MSKVGIAILCVLYGYKYMKYIALSCTDAIKSVPFLGTASTNFNVALNTFNFINGLISEPR